MKSAAFSFVTACIASVGACGLLAGDAWAQTHSAPEGDAAEAWYDTSQAISCSSPLGCPPVTVPATKYPAGTLHVGVSSGMATAVTYVQPDLSTYLDGPLPSEGVMTLPLATMSGNGNANDSSAGIEACLAKSAIEDGTYGSTADPPATNCLVHSEAKYDDTHFTVDLSPFLAAWRAGTPEYGIALVPDPSKSSSPTTTWHVAFNARDATGQPHISSVFSPAPATGTTASTGTSASGAGADTSLGGGPVPAPTAGGSPGPASAASGSPATPSGIPQPSPNLANVPSASPNGTSPPSGPSAVGEPPTAGNVTLANVRGGGFQYPEVMLLPLALAFGLLFVGRLLTRDATPKSLKQR